MSTKPTSDTKGIIRIIFVLLTRKSDKIYETNGLHSIASTGL